MKVIFRGTSEKHVVVFTSLDQSVFQAFSPKAPGSPNSRLLAMIGDSYQNEQAYTRATLLEAATEFRDALERDRPLLPFRYSFEFVGSEIFGGSGGSGGAGGFHIGGKIHSIRGGNGVCYLNEMGIGPDGWGYDASTIDVRDKKCVETDDHGSIRIKRRKLKLSLFETIPLLISFLTTSAVDVFHVVATEDSPSFMYLIRMAGQGSGENDWAEEQMFEMGEEARNALIAKLSDTKANKHHGTIARVLLTVFPSHESRQAVENLVQREEDDELKRLYAVLLAATQQ
jgi:hypothetical protein